MKKTQQKALAITKQPRCMEEGDSCEDARGGHVLDTLCVLNVGPTALG